MDTRAITIASMILLLAIGIGVGWGFQSTVATSSGGTISATVTSTVTKQSNLTEPFQVTLVITTANIFNSTIGDQPAFYVLTPQGLSSSASISLPAHRLIRLVIVNYDDGNADLVSAADSNVTGTVNGTETFVSDANVNSTQGSGGIVIRGGQTVSEVNSSMIAHTFTIPSLGINIPIPVSSTVTTYIKIDKTGTYLWFCETACGGGLDGLGAAMARPGWMLGSTVVS